MTGTKGIKGRFTAFGKAGQPVFLAQGFDLRAPPCQDLVRIGLMTDIPDQPVMRRLKNIMQCHGQLDNAKPGPQMSARL